MTEQMSRQDIYGKQRICLSSSGSAHFHVSWLSNFIFYQKPLYKSLHQSFFYSFITILPSESGVTPHYSTILPQILLFRHVQRSDVQRLQKIHKSRQTAEESRTMHQNAQGCWILNFQDTFMTDLIVIRIPKKRSVCIFIPILFQGLSKVFW